MFFFILPIKNNNLMLSKRFLKCKYFLLYSVSIVLHTEISNNRYLLRISTYYLNFFPFFLFIYCFFFVCFFSSSYFVSFVLFKRLVCKMAIKYHHRQRVQTHLIKKKKTLRDLTNWNTLLENVGITMTVYRWTNTFVKNNIKKQK